jgi:prepilin-type N-terminal cleavage/methylation domain-containing protein
MWAQHKQRGFTIVELLIVIVVIAILAAITVVAFNGVQQRARDTQRKSDLAQIAKALHLYNTDNGSFAGTGSGCGSGGNGAGWYHNDYDGVGPYLSMSQCLLNGKYISASLTDPQWTNGCIAVPDTTPVQNDCSYYMKYECGGGTYLYANLESMPHSTTDTDGGCMTTLDSSYGMNYYVKVN